MVLECMLLEILCGIVSLCLGLYLLFVFHLVDCWVFEEVDEVMTFPFEVIWEFMEVEVLEA